MKNYSVGQKVIYKVCEAPDYKEKKYEGTVKQVNNDVPFPNIIVDVPEISDHVVIYDDNEEMIE